MHLSRYGSPARHEQSTRPEVTLDAPRLREVGVDMCRSLIGRVVIDLLNAVAMSYRAVARGLMVPPELRRKKVGSDGGHLARQCLGVLTMSNPCISSSKVAGTAVYNANGDKLGSIDDLIIDKLSGQVRYAALEFGGFLGMGTDRYPIPWSMLKYDTRLEGYVVPLQKEQLEKAPRYAQTSMPEYTDDYGRKVYDYYGVPWK